ncbi:phenylacetate--CoA ligase family protein [Kitasatospora sp. NPDC058444]|uniref:phenylacetate--CoA ligase family protein n=1 Tax=Kitasatospora sp. NPDC058444 TaxID=3346504 RepID=UPI003653B2AD
MRPFPTVSQYWNPKTETMPREELARWQWRKLRRALDHARGNSPFWRERLPEGVSSLEEYVDRVPLVHKSDLIAAQQEAPAPYGTIPSTDPALAIRYHQTSGTSGNPPFRTFDTARDWAWAVDMWCTALYGAGVRAGQLGCVAFGYGLFMGYWGMHYALERIGGTVVPIGSMDSRSRVRLLIDRRIDVLGCTPTYAMRLVETARDMGVDLAAEANVGIVVTGAEPRPESTARAIADAFGARVLNFAGMTELATVFMFECPAKPGGCHIIEPGVIEEVLHPVTREPVGYGEQGVRVTTALGREGIQIFRYWTDDLVVKRPWHECGCGRTWDWYDGGILGRTDDMRKVRGISVTPVMIEDIMRGFDQVSEYQTILRNVRGLDTIVLRVEPRPAPAAHRSDPAELCERISAEMKRQLGLRPEVELAEAGSLPRFEVKAARFHDERAG